MVQLVTAGGVLVSRQVQGDVRREAESVGTLGRVAKVARSLRNQVQKVPEYQELEPKNQTTTRGTVVKATTLVVSKKDKKVSTISLTIAPPRVTFEVSGGWWDERTAVALLTLGKRNECYQAVGSTGCGTEC